MGIAQLELMQLLACADWELPAIFLSQTAPKPLAVQRHRAEDALQQSLAECPPAPQYRHKFFSIRRLHSSSFSLPSLSEMSGFLGEGVLEVMTS